VNYRREYPHNLVGFLHQRANLASSRSVRRQTRIRNRVSFASFNAILFLATKSALLDAPSDSS
jgi:hypothetical protein